MLNLSIVNFVILILIAFSLPIIFIKFKSKKLDRWIREFSYPIYICHVFIIITVNVFYSKYNFVSHNFLSFIILICTLIFSFFSIKFISEPIEKIRHKRTLKLNSK
jgi:peptidoglycan/LPS O-acetylase OafA/YrhL